MRAPSAVAARRCVVVTASAGAGAVDAGAEALEIEAAVAVLAEAARSKQVKGEAVFAALRRLETRKVGAEESKAWLAALGGAASPGHMWQLVFTAGSGEVRKAAKGGEGTGSYFPIPAIQRFDATAMEIENGVFLGPVGYLTFQGPMGFTARRLAFTFHTLTLKLGPLPPFQWGIGKEEDKGRVPGEGKAGSKDPFFTWFYVDDRIAAARGRGGGAAFWGCIPLVTSQKGCIPLVTSQKGCIPLVTSQKGCIPLVTAQKGCIPLVTRHKGCIPLVTRHSRHCHNNRLRAAPPRSCVHQAARSRRTGRTERAGRHARRSPAGLIRPRRGGGARGGGDRRGAVRAGGGDGGGRRAGLRLHVAVMGWNYAAFMQVHVWVCKWQWYMPVCRKILNLRLWPNEKTGKAWDQSVSQRGYEVLLVSQFTLYGQPKGNKLDFHVAMPPQQASAFYDAFLHRVRRAYHPDRVKDGIFGAMMEAHWCVAMSWPFECASLFVDASPSPRFLPPCLPSPHLSSLCPPSSCLFHFVLDVQVHIANSGPVTLFLDSRKQSSTDGNGGTASKESNAVNGGDEGKEGQ
ncbi:unnamed protein product [Closterium sp. NIES-54]